MIKFLLACAIIFSGAAHAAFGFTSAPLMEKGPSSVCSNPTPPHPAQVAGFTTLAYCADFTSAAMANPSTWLDCAGATTPQWFAYNGGVGTETSCSHIHIVNDSVAGSNVLALTVNPSDGDHAVTFVTTSVQGCSAAGPFGMINVCGENFPTTNMYAEIKYRIDTTAYAGATCDSNCLKWDLFSWMYGTDGGTVEIDFGEIAAGSDQFVTNGMVDWNGTPTFGNNNGQIWDPSDSLYHVIGSLNTANSGVTNVGACTYKDGTGIKCNGIQPGTSAGYQQEGYLIMWNTAGEPMNTLTVPFTGYIEWVRVWSCSGWSSTGHQPPATTSTTNSCVSPTVYNSGTPP